MSAHTPGPWFAVHGMDVDPLFYEFFGVELVVIAGSREGQAPRIRRDKKSPHGTSGWTFIATVGSGIDESTARLIAAAPELLEALKRAHLVTCPTVDPIYHTCGGCSISAVIAKAEGRS